MPEYSSPWSLQTQYQSLGTPLSPTSVYSPSTASLGGTSYSIAPLSSPTGQTYRSGGYTFGQQTYGTGVGQVYPPSVGLPLGTTGTVGSPIYPTSSTSLSSSRPTQTTASGSTIQPQAGATTQPTGYSPAVNTALTGATNWSGSGQPGTNLQSPMGTPLYGQTNTGSTYQPTTTNFTHSPYSQPSGSTAAPRITPEQMYGTQQAQDYRGALSGPGAYERWYQDNASRYNAPTTLSSYYQSVAGQFGGQRYQPTTSQDAYSQAQSQLNSPGYGTQNAQTISQQLQGRTAGEDYTEGALNYLRQPNQANDYYNQTRSFYSQPGAIENYYGQNAQQFMNAGFGENYAQNALGSQQWGDINDMLASQNYGDQSLAMTMGMVGNNQRAAGVYGANQDVTGSNLVGSELDYFRDPLRAKSYSEQLYESGNEGLNTYYARENEKAQEALTRRMAASGVFGSGETVRGMAEIDADLGAAQARDMAQLAQQGDQQRLARAGQLSSMAGAAGQEELARRGMAFDMAMGADQIGQGNMRGLQDAYGLASNEGIAKMQQYLAGQGVALDAANTGLQLDRDAISRLSAGGNLANLSSQYGLDRTTAGMDAANTADASRIAQGTSIANVGNMLSQAEIERLGMSADTGLAADEENRMRIGDLFGMANDVDSLGLQADANSLNWITAGGNMAGNVDQGNLDWLNAGGDAADLAQTRFETRERYGFLDPMALGQAMAGSYGTIATGNTTEQGQMSADAIGLELERQGMSAASARAQAQQWIDMGLTAVQIAALLRNR